MADKIDEKVPENITSDKKSEKEEKDELDKDSDELNKPTSVVESLEEISQIGSAEDE